MRRLLTTIALSAVLPGCGSRAQPSAMPADTSRRAPCDRLAARAIQSTDMVEATTLAAQSSDCYAALQGGL